MDNENSIKLTLSGPSLSYETSVSDTLAVRIMGLCISGITTLAPQSTATSAGGPVSKESVAEYLTRVGARRNPDKILAFAAYLRDQREKQSVSPVELKLLFRDAGELLPANFTRDFNDATASGWLAPEPEKKGYYYVTRTGAEVINKGFDKAPVKRLKQRSPSRKPSSAKGDETAE